MGILDDMLSYLKPPAAHGPPRPPSDPTGTGRAPVQLGGIQAMLSRPGVPQGLLAAAGQLMEPYPNMGNAAQAFNQALLSGRDRKLLEERQRVENARMELEQARMQRQQQAEAQQMAYYQQQAAQGNEAARAMMYGISPEQYRAMNPQPEYMEVPQGDQTVLVRKGQHGLEPTGYQGQRFKQTPDVSIVNTMGSIPQGHRLVDAGTPQERYEVIPGKAEAPEAAAKIAALQQAKANIGPIRQMLFDQGDATNPNRTALLGMNAGLPGQGREARTLILNAVEAKLRAESGAAVPDTEVKRAAERFIPSPFDTADNINLKLQQLDEFLTGALKLTGHGPRESGTWTPASGRAPKVGDIVEAGGKRVRIISLSPDGDHEVELVR